MALTSEQLNEVAALTVQYVNDSVPDLFAAANGLFKVSIDRKNYVSGGKRIQMPVAGVAENGAMGMITGTGADNLNLNINQTVTYGELEWKFLYWALTMDLKEMTITEDSPQAIKSFLKTKMSFARNGVVRLLSTQLHGSAASVANNLNGFTDIFAASGTAYAGITDTDVSNWLAYLPSQIAAANYTNMAPILDVLVSRSSQDNTSVNNPQEGVIYQYKPDIIISDFTQYSNFKTAESLKLRFTPVDTMKTGFVAIEVDGYKWIPDTNCAAKTIYAITSDSFEMFYKYGLEGKASPIDDKALRVPNQPIKTQINFFAGNLGCTNRRVNAKITTAA